jgi:hypothetical protein
VKNKGVVGTKVAVGGTLEGEVEVVVEEEAEVVLEEVEVVVVDEEEVVEVVLEEVEVVEEEEVVEVVLEEVEVEVVEGSFAGIFLETNWFKKSCLFFWELSREVVYSFLSVKMILWLMTCFFRF